ncbi:LysR substrate-binding domain-containing protein [Saccharopolyspora spinosporotrichia]
MELRHLRYFVAIAEEQSLTRAAARLHIAQPPLSAQLRKLETELGAVLVHRTARGTQLTDAGRVLLEEARRILHEVDHAAQMTREAGSGRVGRLSLGFIPSASNVVLPPILRQFKARYPEVRLRLREMRPDEIVERLHDRRIDAGFFYLPIDDPSLHVRSVADDSLVLALPSTHPLADSPRSTCARWPASRSSSRPATTCPASTRASRRRASEPGSPRASSSPTCGSCRPSSGWSRAGWGSRSSRRRCSRSRARERPSCR